jgi:hypothetical protein
MVAFSRPHFWRTESSAPTPNVDHADVILSIPWIHFSEGNSIDLCIRAP